MIAKSKSGAKRPPVRGIRLGHTAVKKPSVSPIDGIKSITEGLATLEKLWEMLHKFEAKGKFDARPPRELVKLSKSWAYDALQNSSSRDVAGILDRAAEVIGDTDEACRWMGTPVRALDYATPISLLANKKGTEQVLAVLTRLEHGVL
jgi:putative toxin-antitoxin system antitoxin component (TIGR02293 family)